MKNGIRLYGRKYAELKRVVKSQKCFGGKIYNIEIGEYQNKSDSGYNSLLKDGVFIDKKNINSFDLQQTFWFNDNEEKIVLDCWCYDKKEELLTNVYVQYEKINGDPIITKVWQ